MRRLVLAVVGVCLLGAGCGQYRDFTLLPLDDRSAAASFRWEVVEGPVLGRGAPGEWDAVDALNPSVVRFEGLYHNLYSGFDGRTWHTGLATSPDGVEWTKQGKVLSPDPGSWEGEYIAANGSAVVVDGEILYWYQAGEPPRIGLARSGDTRLWTKLPQPVLNAGPRGAWDEKGVADPYVVRIGGNFYMFYLGQDRARRQRLGVAVSEDGVVWWKLRSNPILEPGPAGAFDAGGLGEPAVWASHGRYWMLYTARDRREYRRLGLASSTNGVDWERTSDSAVLVGDQAWNSKVVCDPTLEAAPGEIRVWFGGGDVAHPAENLNGQIGLAILRIESANLTK